MKKTWNIPEVKDMEISNTEYYARNGQKVDGSYVDNNGTVIAYTYSGAFETESK